MHISKLDLATLMTNCFANYGEKLTPPILEAWWLVLCDIETLRVKHAIQTWMSKNKKCPVASDIAGMLGTKNAKQNPMQPETIKSEIARLSAQYAKLLAEMHRDGTLLARHDEMRALSAKLSNMERLLL